MREPELFSSEWPPKRLAEPLWTTQDPAEPSWTTQDVAESSWTSESRWTEQDVAEPSWTSESRWTAQDPAEPPWTAQDWAAADSSPRGEAVRRRIDWLDGPDLDDVPQPEPVHAEGTGAATAGWSVSRWDDATKVWDEQAGEDKDRWAYDYAAGDEKVDRPEARDIAVGDHRIRSEADNGWTEDGWTDEDWQRLGDAPTEELFTRRTTPRSHRRPEPMRKVTLRVLAAVLVAGGGVSLTLNLVSADGNNNPPAQTRVEDQNPPRFDGSVAPTQSASPSPTDPQATSQADAATEPLAPATTRKATAAGTTPPAAPAPAPTTTTPPPATSPPTTTPPATASTQAPTSSPASQTAPPASSAPASGQPTS